MLDAVKQHFRRWYDRPLTKLPLSDTEFGWGSIRSELIAEKVQKGDEILYDSKIIVDRENSCIGVAGYLPTREGSKLKGKLAGTTLYWNIPWDFENEKFEMKDIGARIEEIIKTAQINIFTHGHTGDVDDLQPVALEKLKIDKKNKIKSVSLSLGLMGADGTCLSSVVEPGEDPLTQVREVMGRLGEKITNFEERVGLVWGHSMQGNTVLRLATEMADKMSKARFVAVAPVIYGSDKDRGLPEDEKHVWLHSSWRGALVKFLPIIHLIPREAVKRGTINFVNWTGIPANVLGYYVRDRAMAAIHFAECMKNPYYLKRVNDMLKIMPDLRELTFEQKDRLRKLGQSGRLQVVIGGSDVILNPQQMIEYASRERLPVKEIDSGHFPKSEEMNAALGETKPDYYAKVAGLRFKV